MFLKRTCTKDMKLFKNYMNVNSFCSPATSTAL